MLNRTEKIKDTLAGTVNAAEDQKDYEYSRLGIAEADSTYRLS